MPQRKHSEPYVQVTTRVPKALLDRVDEILYNPYTNAPQHGAKQRIIISALEEFVSKHNPESVLSLLKEQ